jgi:hypothetical protein
MPVEKKITPDVASLFASSQLEWKEILTCGKHRCSGGVVFDATPEKLAQLVANFKSSGGPSHPLVCDYNHAGVDGEGDRVSGYVYDLKVEQISRPGYTGPALYALTYFREAARARLAKGELNYTSADIRGTEGNLKLRRFTLLNDPADENQVPASYAASAADEITYITLAKEETTMAEDAKPKDESTANAAALSPKDAHMQLCTLLNLPMDCPWEDIVAKVRGGEPQTEEPEMANAVAAAATDELNVKLASTEIKLASTEARLVALEADNAKLRAKTHADELAVVLASADGRLTGAQVKLFAAQYAPVDSDLTPLKAFVAASPKILDRTVPVEIRGGADSRPEVNGEVDGVALKKETLQIFAEAKGKGIKLTYGEAAKQAEVKLYGQELA